MALAAADVLAGPIVRRVEPDLVSVWIALRKPASVQLEVYRGLGPRTAPGRSDDLIPARPIPPNNATRGSRTLQVGRALHIAQATMEPVTRLEWGQTFAYDLRITEIGTSDEQGLAELGLLRDDPIAGHPHLALGYTPGWLPSFVLPALDPLDLRFAHGSCRLQTAVGKDTMPELDGLISAHLQDDQRLQMLFLTGDQIYADEVGVEMGRILSDIAAGLFGQSVETITAQLDRENAPAGFDFPVDRLHFPVGRRTHLLRDAGLTSDSMSAHAMSIGEFCALYLSMWSNVVWPDLQPLLAARWTAVNDYRDRVGELRAGIRDVAPGERVPKAVKDRIDYYPAWRLLPPEDRAIDAFLTEEDRNTAWNDGGPAAWSNFWLGTEPLFAPTPPEVTAQIPSGMDQDMIARRRMLARALTPSWFAGKQHVGADIGDADPGQDPPIRSDAVRDRLHRMQWFYEGLPRVRRALANVATYMIFDDHEVMDDWNINILNARAIRENPLARCITRNALIAYAVFQGWGNDPREFGREDSVPNKVLDEIAGLFFDGEVPRTIGPRQPATDELERYFDLQRFDPTPMEDRMRWDYRYDGSGFEILALDTRTMRSFERDADPSLNEPFTEYANAALMSTEAMLLQIPPDPPAGVGAIPDPASGGFSIVLSPAPVLGFPPVESLFQPILNLKDTKMSELPTTGTFGRLIDAYDKLGRVTRDPEPWGFVPAAFEALLARLRSRRRTIFLSGDVHYGCTVQMSYWRRNNAELERSRFIQLTASAFLKEQNILITEYFSMDLAQQLGLALAQDVERFGWVKGITGSPEAANPVEPPAGGAFSERVRYLMQVDPILLAPQALPVDRRFIRQPEWSWRMRLIGDERPDAERLIGFNPPQLLPVTAGQAQMTKSVADRHRWQVEHAPDRRWLWFANFGVVDFVVEQDPASGQNAAWLRHALYSFDLAGEGAAARPYSIAKVRLDVPADELAPGMVEVPPVVPS